MMHARGWPTTSSSHGDDEVVLIAVTPSVRACCINVVDDRTILARTVVEATIRAADAATAEYAPRQLVVLALHEHDVRADVRAFVDAANATRVMYLELWHKRRQLGVNVLEHIDVPRHRLATSAESERYPHDQLPLLRVDDPVARWLGFRENDIVAVEHDDDDTGASVYLRRVVA